MEEMIKRILTNEIVYVPEEKDIESFVKSVFGGCQDEISDIKGFISMVRAKQERMPKHFIIHN